jgi:hypothetical protein
MKRLVLPPLLLVTGLSAGALETVACETPNSTYARVDNAYPIPGDASVAGAIPDGGEPAPQTVVYRAWYSVTYFGDPIAAGEASPPQLVVTTSDTAYALLAPGWDPQSGAAPTALIAVQSKQKVFVGRGDTVTIHVSDDTFEGNCAAGSALTQDEADVITQRVFPAEFGGGTYDAKTCTFARHTDGGSDAGREAGKDAGDAG